MYCSYPSRVSSIARSRGSAPGRWARAVSRNATASVCAPERAASSAAACAYRAARGASAAATAWWVRTARSCGCTDSRRKEQPGVQAGGAPRGDGALDGEAGQLVAEDQAAPLAHEQSGAVQPAQRREVDAE